MGTQVRGQRRKECRGLKDGGVWTAGARMNGGEIRLEVRHSGAKQANNRRNQSGSPTIRGKRRGYGLLRALRIWSEVGSGARRWPLSEAVVAVSASVLHAEHTGWREARGAAPVVVRVEQDGVSVDGHTKETRRDDTRCEGVVARQHGDIVGGMMTLVSPPSGSEQYESERHVRAVGGEE